MVERRTIVSPRSAAIASARLRRSTDVVPARFAPPTFHAGYLDRGRARRHHDHRGCPEPLCGQRHGLAVVTGREGDDAALQGVRGQPFEHVRGAADLERATRLLRFALEPQRPAGKIGNIKNRSATRNGRYAFGSVANRIERDKCSQFLSLMSFVFIRAISSFGSFQVFLKERDRQWPRLL